MRKAIDKAKITEHKKSAPDGAVFLAENWQLQNFGRELVFSADMCYNDMGDASG